MALIQHCTTSSFAPGFHQSLSLKHKKIMFWGICWNGWYVNFWRYKISVMHMIQGWCILFLTQSPGITVRTLCFQTPEKRCKSTFQKCVACQYLKTTGCWLFTFLNKCCISGLQNTTLELRCVVSKFRKQNYLVLLNKQLERHRIICVKNIHYNCCCFNNGKNINLWFYTGLEQSKVHLKLFITSNFQYRHCKVT